MTSHIYTSEDIEDLCAAAARASMETAQTFLVDVRVQYENSDGQIVVPEGALQLMLDKLDDDERSRTIGTLRNLSAERLDKSPRDALHDILQTLGLESIRPVRLVAEAHYLHQMQSALGLNRDTDISRWD